MRSKAWPLGEINSSACRAMLPSFAANEIGMDIVASLFILWMNNRDRCHATVNTKTVNRVGCYNDVVIDRVEQRREER